MTNKTYTATQIANEFIKIGNREGRYFDQLQLQKLVYFTHGFSLVSFDDFNITQNPLTFQYGPVYKDLWNKLTEFGRTPVIEQIDNNKEEDISSNDEIIPVIEFIFKTYGRLTGAEMSDLTHKENTPWSETVATKGYKKDILPNLIRDHFRSVVILAGSDIKGFSPLKQI